jgi:hypothetical protein
MPLIPVIDDSDGQVKEADWRQMAGSLVAVTTDFAEARLTLEILSM